MQMRKATKEDAYPISILTKQAFIRYASAIGETHKVSALNETEDDIISDINAKNVYVAEHEDKIIGCIRFEIKEDIAYISRFCSDKNSEIHGIGISLIEYIKNICNKKDIHALLLHTSTNITSLVQFYYSCGFYIYDVNHKKGYPRGLFVYDLGKTDTNFIDFSEKYFS